MTIRNLENFSGMDWSNLARFGWVQRGITTVSGTLRPACTNLALHSGFTSVPAQWQFPAPLTTCVVGSRIGNTAAGGQFFCLLDSTGSFQLALYDDGTNFTVYSGVQGSGGILLGSVPRPAVNAQNYLAVYATIHATAGVVKVEWNGTTILNLTGQNTNVTGLANVGHALWGPTGIALTDCYLLDSVAPNNDFLGDVQVTLMRATGAGTHTDFAHGGSGDLGTNWQDINEYSAGGTAPDFDATYVQSSTVGAKDTYTVAPAGTYDHGGGAYATVTAVYGMVEKVTATKTDTPPRGLKPLVRSSTTEVTGTELALVFGPSEVWNLATLARDTDPATAAAFTLAGLNAVEIGETVSS